MIENIKVIAFDADDTLWVNEPYFQDAQVEFGQIVKEWIDPELIVEEHYKSELKNIPIYGYGIKGFTLSLIDTALRVSKHQISASQIKSIIDLGKKMHSYPVELLPGVEETLQTLSKDYRLIVATKGDLLDQERKLERSKLSPYFHHVEVMSEKTAAHYQKLVRHLDVAPEAFAMVGNSLKSDILPVLEFGGFGIHIPYHIAWVHEEVNDFDHKHPNFRQFKNINDICSLFRG